MQTVLHQIIDRAPDLAPLTKARYTRDLNQWIAFAGDSSANWTRAKAQEFYQSLLDRGLKVQSANRVMASVRYVSKWWAHREMRPDLDFGVVQTAKEHVEKKRHALSQEQVMLLLNACRGDDPIALRDFAFIVILLETGMRRMSIRSMLWQEISNDPYPHARVLMKDSGTVRRPVPLSDTALFALNRWHVFSLEHGIKNGPVFRALSRKMTSKGRILHKPAKTALGATAIQNLLDSRVEAAGIEHVHPHIFRHTLISWRMAAGFSPVEIASITGHTLPNLGAMAGYVDMFEVGGRVRNGTPMWLVELVRSP